MNDKVFCVDCGWRGKTSDLLRAKNPFLDGEELIACPECRNMDIEPACSYDGCWKRAGCGTPSKNGYKITCANHIPE